ncbi:MAG: hypothetical protein WC465_04870 [Patescibacteria group bacterium]
MQSIIESQEDKIQFIERNQDKIDQVGCDVRHTFAPGICIREVHMKAGSYIIGHRHTTEHTNIMICGHMLLQNDAGGWDELIGQAMYVAKPGRKVAQILEDVVWLNIFPTESQDIDWIESTFLDKSEAWQEGAQEVKQALLPVGTKKRLPSGTYGFKIVNNEVICLHTINKNDIIGHVLEDGSMSILAENIKHSDNPNAKILGNDIIAITDISGCIGGLDGDKITIGIVL